MTRIWTIGHSTRPIDDFLAALRSFEVQVLADVRRFPASRRNPQYRTEDLKKSLFHAGIEYRYLGDELGGWRKASLESKHVTMRSESFRGYADWMERPAFRAAAQALAQLARTARVATLCAERLPQSCHRHLLSDHLVLVEGLEVVDVLDAGVAKPHRLSPTARREGDGVVYDVAPGAPRLESFEP